MVPPSSGHLPRFYMIYTKLLSSLVIILVVFPFFHGKLGGFFDQAPIVPRSDTKTSISAHANSGGNEFSRGGQLSTGEATASVEVSTVTGDSGLIMTIETVAEPETAVVIVTPTPRPRPASRTPRFLIHIPWPAFF